MFALMAKSTNLMVRFLRWIILHFLNIFLLIQAFYLVHKVQKRKILHVKVLADDL